MLLITGLAVRYSVSVQSITHVHVYIIRLHLAVIIINDHGEINSYCLCFRQPESAISAASYIHYNYAVN